MEIFVGAMQELVDEINTSADERKEAIRLISEDVYSFRSDVNRFMKEVQDFVHGLQLENIEHARATREKLSFDEKARLEAARLFMVDTRSNLKSVFDLSRAEREFAVKTRLDDIRKELSDIRTELANGQRVWAERNSNGNGRHAKKTSEDDALPVKKESRHKKKTAKK